MLRKVSQPLNASGSSLSANRTCGITGLSSMRMTTGWTQEPEGLDNRQHFPMPRGMVDRTRPQTERRKPATRKEEEWASDVDLSANTGSRRLTVVSSNFPRLASQPRLTELIRTTAFICCIAIILVSRQEGEEATPLLCNAIYCRQS